MRDEILTWLNEGCDLNKGVALYLLYGDNPHFKMRIVSDPARHSRRIRMLLLDLIGSPLVSVAEVSKRSEEDKFRTMYPFLSDSGIPFEIKALATEKMTTYWNMVRLHDELFQCHKNSECLATARSLVETFIEDQAIKAELDHFGQFRKPLGKHRIFEEQNHIRSIRSMSIKDLFKKERQLEDNIWRIKSEIAKKDKPHLDSERLIRLEQRQRELQLVKDLIG